MEQGCTFCGSQKPRRLFSTTVGDSFFCTQCGGVRNHSKNGPAIYSKNYYSDYAAVEAQQVALFSSILKSVDPFVTNRRVLDVGCGTGLFLKTAYAHGYRESVGFDVSVDAVSIARTKLTGTDAFLQVGSQGIAGQFGLIAFMDSIAHIENMEEVITTLLAEKLSPGGILVIKTPFYSKCYFRYADILGRILGLVGKSGTVSSGLLFLPTRHYLFTEPALKQFMQRRGFGIVQSDSLQEYSLEKPMTGGLKNRLFEVAVRRFPRTIFGNKTIILIAKKALKPTATPNQPSRSVA